MSFYVYMLRSNGKKKVTYVGYTKDLNKRIKLHNLGKGANLLEVVNGRIYKSSIDQKVAILENII